MLLRSIQEIAIVAKLIEVSGGWLHRCIFEQVPKYGLPNSQPSPRRGMAAMEAVEDLHPRHKLVRRTSDHCNTRKLAAHGVESGTGLTVCQKAGKPDAHARFGCNLNRVTAMTSLK